MFVGKVNLIMFLVLIFCYLLLFVVLMILLVECFWFVFFVVIGVVNIMLRYRVNRFNFIVIIF